MIEAMPNIYVRDLTELDTRILASLEKTTAIAVQLESKSPEIQLDLSKTNIEHLTLRGGFWPVLVATGLVKLPQSLTMLSFPHMQYQPEINGYFHNKIKRTYQKDELGNNRYPSVEISGTVPTKSLDEVLKLHTLPSYINSAIAAKVEGSFLEFDSPLEMGQDLALGEKKFKIPNWFTAKRLVGTETLALE